ncbi:MAG: hypothetical protein KF858_14575 [Candidatus Sumerlaeia bacterium]|nr:hypothetical protein [Candidatus Sumerlaeia bacterium]
MATVSAPAGGAEEAFAAVRRHWARTALAFVGKAAEADSRGTTFNVSNGNFRAMAADVDTPYWGVRIAGPGWRVEVVADRSGAETMLTLRRQVLPNARFPEQVAEFLRKVGLATAPGPAVRLEHSGAPVGAVLELRKSRDLDLFERLLAHPRRRMPILLVSETDPHTNSLLVDPASLAVTAADALLSVTITYELAYELSDRIGKVWSCYMGAVRVYQPGADLLRGDPWDHPLHLPARLSPDMPARAAEEARRKSGEWEMDWWMLDFLEDASASRRTPIPVPPPAPPTPEEPVEETQHEPEVEGLLLRVSRLEGELERMRALVRRLGAAVRSEGNQVPIPGSLLEVQEWVEEHYGGRLVLLPRALRGARESVYRDPPLVYKCLQFLATEYRDARVGEESTQEAPQESIRRLGVELTRSISPSRAGQEGDTYFVHWPTSKDRRWFLEWHLKKGTSHDPRESLRIYFFWDAQREQVVVGWMTSHLENRFS